jgi:hypothetical protein
MFLLPPVGAAPAWLPVSQIRVGMTGIGKTVTLGTKVTEFQVRILGVLKGAGPAGDLVLFRAGGPAIQSVGGLAAGMSGSPIYLGGRLAGAFSYMFQASDPMVGLFTPIADMLKDLPPRAAHLPRTYAVAPLAVAGRTIRWITLASQGPPAHLPAAHTPASQTLVAVPAATPLFVSGFSAAGRAALARVFEPMGVVPIEGSGPVNLPASVRLQPGSAIGVGLMQGDISAYAIGTLTYMDGSRILAFGHPFTDVGKARYLLANAAIFQTVRGQDHNMNVGAAGSVVGTISEDRPAAIGGTVGVFPRLFGVRMRVTDADAGTSRQYNFQIVTNKEIAPALVMLGAQTAIERGLNRSGEGTAEVRMLLHGRGLPHTLERVNDFYSGNDVAQRALAEVPQALALLFNNDFADVSPADMEMDVRVTGDQETATITNVAMPTAPVAAGSTLSVRVTIRPFRGQPQAKDVTLNVPEDFPPGPAVLVVRAGGTALPPSSVPGAAVSAASASVQDAPRSLTEAVTAFEQGEKNTDVVLELVGSPQRSPAQAAPATTPRATGMETTPWVLRGRFQAPVTIEGGSH